MSAAGIHVIATAMTPLARTSEGSKSGPIGLAIILLLCVACYFLFKSMSGHLRRVREDFPKDAPAAAPTAATTPVVVAKPDAVDAQADDPAAPDQS